MLAGTYTEKSVWRTCKHSEHVYEMSVGDKVRSFLRTGTSPDSCPLCLNRRTVRGVNDLATTHPDLVRELLVRETPGLNPSKINAGYKDKVWWQCPAGHRYEKPVAKRALLGENCPVCNGSKVLAGFNDLATLSPEIAATWHPSRNSAARPENLAPQSNRKFWWICEKGHEYECTVAHRWEGKACPYCVNKRLLKGFNDLATVRPDLALEFNTQKNGITPEQFVAGSSKNYWWKCAEGHEWKQKPIVRLTGRSCPDCAEIGFHPERPALFYFIVHDEWMSGKVGITNQEAKQIRLKRHGNFGWRLVWDLKDDSGHKVRELERATLKWIRKELGLPQHLGKREMSETGGWTETFSMGDLSEIAVIKKVKKLWSEL